MSDTTIASEGTTQNTDASQTAEATQLTATDTTAATATDAAASTESQATDGKVTEGTEQAADGTDSDAESAQGAPEKYEFKAPEGHTLDEGVIAEFSNVAKELNLSQDAAQKMIDALAPKIAAQNREAFEKQITETRTAWVDSVKADKEFGGEKLNENLSVAKKALEKFGSPELRTLLETTGLGDNPEIIRAFYRAGKAISEDTIVPGGTKPATASKDAATALYGNSK